MMKKLTILLAHPNYKNSIANKAVIDELIKAFPQANLRNLYSLYPNFKIDVEAEQLALIESDVILLQFPMQWYNMPPLMKLWFDDVLTYGFAYGEGGDKLIGKIFYPSVTTGGPHEAYTHNGASGHTVDELLVNFELTASFTSMLYEKPHVTYNCLPMHSSVDEVRNNATMNSQALIDKISQLL